MQKRCEATDDIINLIKSNHMDKRPASFENEIFIKNCFQLMITSIKYGKVFVPVLHIYAHYLFNVNLFVN